MSGAKEGYSTFSDLAAHAAGQQHARVKVSIFLTPPQLFQNIQVFLR